jgi:hypothetical protein
LWNRQICEKEKNPKIRLQKKLKLWNFAYHTINGKNEGLNVENNSRRSFRHVPITAIRWRGSFAGIGGLVAPHKLQAF